MRLELPRIALSCFGQSWQSIQSGYHVQKMLMNNSFTTSPYCTVGDRKHLALAHINHLKPSKAKFELPTA